MPEAAAPKKPAPPKKPAAPRLSPKLKELDALLPEAPNPVGSYVPMVQTGNLLFNSGMIPIENGQLRYTGTVGSIALPVAVGQQAARLCVLNALAVIKKQTGSLSKIKRIVKLTGFVSSAPSFYQQPAVINGASDLLVEYFGEKGKHARSAVGVTSLPLDASVEIELIVEI